MLNDDIPRNNNVDCQSDDGVEEKLFLLLLRMMNKENEKRKKNRECRYTFFIHIYTMCE